MGKVIGRALVPEPGEQREFDGLIARERDAHARQTLLEHARERTDQVLFAGLRPVDVQLALGALRGPPRAAHPADAGMQGERAEVTPPDRHAGRHQPLAVAAKQRRDVRAPQTLMHQPVRDGLDRGVLLQLIGHWTPHRLDDEAVR